MKADLETVDRTLPAPLDAVDLVAREPLPADRHPAAVYLAHLAEGSRRTMHQALDTIADLVASGHDAQSLFWPGLRYQHTAAIRTALLARFRPATVNKMLSALKGVLKECWRLGYLDAETYHRAVDLPAVRGETLPRGRALTLGELHALFGVCSLDTSPAGVRDAALLGLLYGCGMRRSEVVALDLEHYDPETGQVTIRGAKGAKDRLVYATNGILDAVNDWLFLRGPEPGALFCPVLKSGAIRRKRMTDQAVYNACCKRAEQAGVKAFSPHDLRRSCISDLLDAGADLATVQKLAGHANVTTTARYDRRGEKAKQKAAELLTIPYVARRAG